jgi:5-methyltetrahydrofolate--homocysteine methyltransferase
VNSQLLEALAHRVLVWDGATGTQLQAADLGVEDFTLRPGLSPSGDLCLARGVNPHLDGCNELLTLTRPDVIEAVHRRYFEAGSDMVETNTFGATSIVLAEYDVPEMVEDISRAAARIAVKAARELSTEIKPRFAIGALGPGTKLVSLGQVGWNNLVQTYREGFRAMIEEGVDGLLLETLQDLLMVKAGIVAAHEAMAETETPLPIIVQVTLEQTGTMLVGSDIGAALNFLECFPRVVAVGMNCATGPAEMAPYVRFLGQNSTRPLSIQPNAGLPQMEKGQAVYKLSPSELADHHEHFVNDFGVAMVGGCCGTTPAHIQAVAERVGGKPHVADCHWRKVANLFPGFDFAMRTPAQSEALSLVGCSSLYQFQPYEQDKSFLIVGERTNANGSKAFREMLAAENWEGLTELAREQEGEGSHLLDVCTAYVGRDEVRDMRILLGYYNRQITVPIMIDSTEVPVIEAALQTVAGKPLINSINFEDGEARTEKVLALCAKYGAAVVALTIDEEGMAKTAQRKFEIAARILDRTRAAGLPDHDIFIDALTFTLGSGDEEFRKSGMETVEAIRMLRAEFPRVNTILGVSNVSFGLKPAARVVLNSVFLQACREAGLTSAIVHFSKIRPENQVDGEVWKIAEDLVFDRRQFAMAEA